MKRAQVVVELYKIYLILHYFYTKLKDRYLHFTLVIYMYVLMYVCMYNTPTM